jgi:hypothetical protein
MIVKLDTVSPNGEIGVVGPDGYCVLVGQLRPS